MPRVPNEMGGFDDPAWDVPRYTTAFIEPEHEAALRMGSEQVRVVQALPSLRWYVAIFTKSNHMRRITRDTIKRYPYKVQLLYELWPSPPAMFKPENPDYVLLDLGPTLERQVEIYEEMKKDQEERLNFLGKFYNATTRGG